MIEDDAQLVQKILLGDDTAFSTLMRKHYKSIHSFVWKKVKDFHYAEDITQEVFIQVYRKLPTLKDLNQFVRWLYAIAHRLCINWIQRNKSPETSLDNTSQEEIEEYSYAYYMSEQCKIASSEHNSEIVKQVLEKLPEGERVVMTLYYLGEMTTKEIGERLGISVNTVTSRLQRARKRLQKKKIGKEISETIGVENT